MSEQKYSDKSVSQCHTVYKCHRSFELRPLTLDVSEHDVQTKLFV